MFDDQRICVENIHSQQMRTPNEGSGPEDGMASCGRSFSLAKFRRDAAALAELVPGGTADLPTPLDRVSRWR